MPLGGKNQSESLSNNYQAEYNRQLRQRENDLKSLRKLSIDQERELSRIRKELREQELSDEERARLEIERKASEERKKRIQEEGTLKEKIEQDIAENSGKSTMAALSKGVSFITDKLDPIINKYIQTQQALSAHLVGSGSTLSNITESLQNTLSSSSIVKQENVYNNLASLVKSGITYNVEQRAFLQTIANDIDAVFNATDGSLTRLIRLQRQDLSSNRLAIEYSLQTFLNQNYQTSEYIKQFTDTSSRLLSAQSTMTGSNAMAFEAAVQQQLGSFYSAGVSENTISSLASAINDLGSGNVSNVGSGMSNLVLMAAARAGLDYGNLLNNGLNAQTATTILSTIPTLLNEMGANQSNVVRSQLGTLFGIDISDIMAAQNIRTTSGSVSTDIYSTLLNSYGQIVPATTQLTNILENFMYTWGTNIASSPGELIAYEASKLIANIGPDIITAVVGSGELGERLSAAARLTPLLPLVVSGLQTLGDGISSLRTSFSGASGVMQSLGRLGSPDTVVRSSQAGTSESLYLGTGGVSDILGSSRTSLSEISTVSAVTNEGPTIEENIRNIDANVTSMLDILDTYMESINNAVINISAVTAPVLTGVRAVTGGLEI